jgi:hypothetical protein
VIQVPTSAIRTIGANKTVQVLYGADKTPVMVRVQTGAVSGQMTEIVSCVDTGNQCLREGDTLAVTVAASTTTGTTPGGGFIVGPGGGAFPGGAVPGGGFTRGTGGNR